MSSANPTLLAVQFFDDRSSPTSSAERLARETIHLLDAHPAVTLDFSGLRGVSSGYFNGLLLGLKQALAGQDVRTRLLFKTDSQAQRVILLRSVDAVLGARSASDAA